MYNKDREEEKKYQDRWILEQLEHKLSPILRKIKADIADLEVAITDIILEERKRIRNDD